ncbi:hypothetical protein FRC04_010675 [Tulasnella sp. 424]|nr:hypothetical protein FRC04_010675 [Tulasnella sp. 424]KAG8972395.1 hypothetical protein FRC05_010106 [Tulasnella sp. 425]
MHNIFKLAFATAGLLASVSAAPFPPIPSGIIFCDIARLGAPIVASTTGTAVTNLQLAVDVTRATLKTAGFTGGYDFVGGGIGAFDGCHDFWLNIGTSAHSYKPLSWAFDDKETTTWVASEGSTISAAATSSYSATSEFLACEESGTWYLYLQTGTDVPAGVTCATTELFAQSSAIAI